MWFLRQQITNKCDFFGSRSQINVVSLAAYHKYAVSLAKDHKCLVSLETVSNRSHICGYISNRS